MIAVLLENLKEAEPLLDRLRVTARETEGAAMVLQAQMGADSLVLVQPGVGKVCQGAALALLWQRFHPELLLCLGNCGATHAAEAQLGELAVSTQALQYDVNFAALGYPAPLLPGMEQAAFAADPELQQLALRCARQVRIAAHSGVFGTADRFVANREFSAKLRRHYSVSWVDNDTAAAAQAAAQFGVKWVSIKGVCHFANDVSGDQYYKNRAAATAAACEAGYAVLRALLRPQPCADCEGGEPMSCDVSLSRMQPLTPQQAEEVLRRARYARLSMAEKEQPYTVPMAFSWRHTQEGYAFCLYSREEGRKMQCLAANSAVALEFDVPEEDGVSSVTVQGAANLTRGEMQYACNNGLSAVRVEAQALAGRRYFFCR